MIGYSELLEEESTERGQHFIIEELTKIENAGRRLLELFSTVLVPIAAPAKETEPPEKSVEYRGIKGRHRPAKWLDAVERELRLAAEAGHSRSNYSHESPSLLVVDDEATGRYVFARKLFRHDFAVCTAQGGREALETLAGHLFDVVLLDIEMPEMDGLEVLSTIRKYFSLAELPVIMVTGRATPSDTLKALELGANDYLTKPVNLEVAVARIRTQLELKSARDQVAAMNSQLLDTQARLARVIQTTPRDFDDLEDWVLRTASDAASVLGVSQIDVYQLRGEQVVPLTGESSAPPTVAQLKHIRQTGKPVPRDDEMIIPLFGMKGSLHGVVIMPRILRVKNTLVSRLLEVLTGQLAYALELADVYGELGALEDERTTNITTLRGCGVEVLHLCPACGRCYGQEAANCEVDDTVLDGSTSLPFRIADRYQLQRLLGEGGMGTVFSARDLRLERDVALKVIASELTRDTKARARFEHEARVVAGLSHPGIIDVHDCSELEDGTLFIVMELLQGANLGTIIEAFGPGKPWEVVALLRQAAGALSEAHGAGLVHRDIKPENFFLSPSADGFRVKLLDFGLAKELIDGLELTATGAVVGTPLFMSPEQALARPVDHRSDIYSLATLGYYALTGHTVTTQNNIAKMMLEVIGSVPTRLVERCEAIPPSVDRAYFEALKKQPEGRPAGVLEWVESFADELAAVRSTLPGWTRENGDLRIL